MEEFPASAGSRPWQGQRPSPSHGSRRAATARPGFGAGRAGL